MQAPPTFSITVSFAVIEPHRFPWNPQSENQNRGSHKATHNPVGELVVPAGFSLSLEEPEAQERPVHVVLHWPGGGGMRLMCSSPSYPSNAVCLGLWGAKGGSVHSCVLRFSVVYCSWMVVGCSCKGEWSQEGSIFVMSPPTSVVIRWIQARAKGRIFIVHKWPGIKFS